MTIYTSFYPRTKKLSAALILVAILTETADTPLPNMFHPTSPAPTQPPHPTSPKKRGV